MREDVWDLLLDLLGQRLHGMVAGLVCLRRRRDLNLVLKILDPLVNRLRKLVIVATGLVSLVPRRINADAAALFWTTQRQLVLRECHIVDSFGIGRQVRQIVFVAAVWLAALVFKADALLAQVVELAVELGALLHLPEHQDGVVHEGLREDRPCLILESLADVGV